MKQVDNILCYKCKTPKSIGEYFPSRLRKHDYICKKCCSKKDIGKRKQFLNKLVKNSKKIKCEVCEKKKLVSEFYFANLIKYDNVCKLCIIEKRNKYAKENRLKINNRTAMKRKKDIIKWLKYFKLKGWDICSKCGYNKCFVAIEFHHKNPKGKKFRIGRFYSLHVCNDINIKKVETEIKKCTILCANCHREEHYKKSKGVNK